MKRLIYGSLSVLTAIGTVFLAAKAEVFSAENRPSANSEEITAAGLDKADDFSSLPTPTGLLGALPGALPTDGLLSTGLTGSTGSTKASSMKAGSIEADLAKGDLTFVPKRSLLATKGPEFQPIAGQSLIESVSPRPLSSQAQTSQAQTYSAQTVPTTVPPAGIQAQSTPAAKPDVVQQSVPPVAASESVKPIEGDADLTAPTAPGVVPSTAPGLIPSTTPGTLIVPATPNNLAPEEDPISEEESAPAADLAPAEGLSPEADLTPESGSSPAGNLTPSGNIAPASDLTPEGNIGPAGDLAPEDNVAPGGRMAPSLSPMPSEGIIRESNPTVTPDDSGVSPAGISPAGVPPTGFPSEAEPMTPLPSAPIVPSMGAPSMAPSADPSVDPSIAPSDDSSVEPQPIEPLPPSPLPPSPLPPANDSAAPNEFPVSGSSSDRLVGEGFSPFQLSYLALAGGLKEEGIPGGTQLVSAYKQGDLLAEDVVAAGATSNRLGTAASDQADYTDGVDRFLEIFRKDARSSN